jgi:hypothetical protein
VRSQAARTLLKLDAKRELDAIALFFLTVRRSSMAKYVFTYNPVLCNPSHFSLFTRLRYIAIKPMYLLRKWTHPPTFHTLMLARAFAAVKLNMNKLLFCPKKPKAVPHFFTYSVNTARRSMKEHPRSYSFPHFSSGPLSKSTLRVTSCAL